MQECLSPEQLEQWVAKELSDRDSQEVSNHVAQCAQCQRRLEQLEGDLAHYEPSTDATRPVSFLPVSFVKELKARSPSEDGATTQDVEADRTALEPVPAVLDLPGYEILDVLGKGGMGRVLKARQLSLKRLVAVKMILGPWASDPGHRARFRREAEAVARLQHPHIVQIHDVGECDGQPFLALELMEQESLADRLKRSALPPREAAALLEKIARAIHFAHEHQIIHRDLKPANVLMSADGTPKVADFGLAKLLDEESDQTQVGQAVGTPRYMAPEQVEGRLDKIGPATDVYGLGAVLYEMLTGEPPLKGRGQRDTLDLVLRKEPSPPRRLNAKIPRDLETICLKCLAKESERRYGSAEDLANDLKRFLDNVPIRARRPTLPERAVKFTRRNRALVASVAIVVAIAASALTLIHTFQQRGERKRAEKHASIAQALINRGERERAEKHASIAQALINRGDWRGALAELDKALKAGHSEPSGLRLQKIQCRMAINDLALARSELDKLIKEGVPERHRGRLLLLEGDFLLGVDNERAKELLRRASKHAHVSDADREYALGHLAETMPAAAEHFERAVELDGAHQLAIAAAAYVHLFRGRTKKVGEHVTRLKVLYADDPNLYVIEAMSHALQGDASKAKQNLEKVASQLRTSERELLELGMELLAVLHDLENAMINGMPKGLKLKLMLRLAQGGIDVKPLFDRQPEARQQGRDVMAKLRVPPILEQGYGRLIKPLHQYSVLGRRIPDEAIIAELAHAVKVNPDEGTTLYFATWMRYQRLMEAVPTKNGKKEAKFKLPEHVPELKRLELDFVRCADLPSLFDVKLLALDNAAYVAAILDQPWRPNRDTDGAERAVQYLRKRRELRPWGERDKWGGRIHHMIIIAANGGDAALAAEITKARDALEKD